MLLPRAGGRPLVLSLAATAGSANVAVSRSVNDRRTWSCMGRVLVVREIRGGGPAGLTIIGVRALVSKLIFVQRRQSPVEELLEERGGGDGVELRLLTLPREL